MKISKTIILLLALAIVSSCKKNDTATTTTTTTGVEYKAAFSLDGTVINFPGITGSMRNGVSSEKSLKPYPDTSNASYISFFDVSSPQRYLYITKGRLFFTNGTRPQPALFNSFFTSGSIPYQYDSSSLKRDGIVIEYLDENNVRWSSSIGQQDVSAKFNISKSAEKTVMFETFLDVEGSFNCKVYDGKGNSKIITGGTYFGAFENM